MKQKMKMQVGGAGALALALGTVLFSAQPLLADEDNEVTNSYSGEAIGIYLNNLPDATASPVVVAQAGPLAAFGGKDDASADHVDMDADAVTCDHADAHVEGHDNHSDSHAHVAHFHIQFTGSDGSVNTVDADDVDAHATVHRKGGPDDEEMDPGDKGPDDEDFDVDADGHAHVHGLVVNGVKYNIHDDEEQTLTFPGFTLVINHQEDSESDDEGQAVATGIRIVVSDTVYAEVGKAEADLVSEEEGESDVVSGSGTFTASNGDVDTFSFSGGAGGALIFSDQTAGVNVVSTGLTSVTQVNATTEQLVYSCLINGVVGTATCVVQDVGGMFGAGDTFSISLSTGFTASGTLNSGEIVLLN